MSDRITRVDVDRIAATVTSWYDGTTIELQAQRRNGYLALDLYRNGHMIDMLTAGTAREVYTYLQGMRRAQLLARG
jgi:hypothetical protein